MKSLIIPICLTMMLVLTGCVQATLDSGKEWYENGGGKELVEGVAKDAVDAGLDAGLSAINKRLDTYIANMESKFGKVEDRFDKNEDGIMQFVERFDAFLTLWEENKKSDDPYPLWAILALCFGSGILGGNCDKVAVGSAKIAAAAGSIVKKAANGKGKKGKK